MRWLFLILFALPSPFLSAQLLNFGNFNTIDSNYISFFNETYSVSGNLLQRKFFMRITDLEGFGNTIEYSPNANLKFGLTGSYKGYRLGFSFNIPNNTNNKGITKSFGLFAHSQTSIYNLSFDFYYNSDQGYYLKKPELHYPSWNQNQAYPSRSDMKSKNIGISLQLIFSSKLSLKAALYQDAKQDKSAGGFGFDVAFRNTNLGADSSIIPFTQLKYYKTLNSITNLKYRSIAIAPTYAYTFVYKHFFSTSLVSLGIAYQTQERKSSISSDISHKMSSRFKLMQIIGFQYLQWFGNVNYTYEDNIMKINNEVRFNTGYNALNFVLGKRF